MNSTTHSWINNCIAVALFLPLASCVITGLIRQRYAWIATFIAPLLLLLSAVASVLVFISLFNNHTPYYIPFEWFSLGEFHFSAGVELNDQSVIMLPVVTIISFLVHFYSAGYMAGDKNIRRYFAVLGFFTFSMLGIILSDNLLMIFVFWELVGFSSYILIGHWADKPAAGAAAKKAFIFNRIGDAGFLIGLMIVWANSTSFSISALAHTEALTWHTAASLCLFCGVVGKSAQFPLLTWLPDAMEGPTPASALIHAATMVAAGVFLLVRFFFLFTPEALNVVAVTGAVTSLMAAISATVQFDIKKILAYSTISQLGLMVLAVGTGAPDAAMLHLVAHAFFKAGLFLCAGGVIHALHQVEQQTHKHFDAQDIRNSGALRKQLPVTFTTFAICGAALSGLPLFSGFLSKDAILMGVWSWGSDGLSWRIIIVAIAFIIPFLTMVYTFRMVWFVFLRDSHLNEMIGSPVVIDEVPVVMRVPMILLSICSMWFVVSINPLDFSGWLSDRISQVATVHISFITVLSACWVLLAFVLSVFYFRSGRLVTSDTMIRRWIAESYYVDRIFEMVISKPARKISTLAEKIDRKWIDGIIHAGAYFQVTLAHIIGWVDQFIVDGSVNGMARLAGGLGAFTRSFQNGKIQLYIFWTVLAIIIFLIWMLK